MSRELPPKLQLAPRPRNKGDDTWDPFETRGPIDTPNEIASPLTDSSLGRHSTPQLLCHFRESPSTAATVRNSRVLPFEPARTSSREIRVSNCSRPLPVAEHTMEHRPRSTRGICQPRSVEAVVRLKSSFHWKPSTCMGFLSLLLARNPFLSLSPCRRRPTRRVSPCRSDTLPPPSRRAIFCHRRRGRDTKSKDTGQRLKNHSPATLEIRERLLRQSGRPGEGNVSRRKMGRAVEGLKIAIRGNVVVDVCHREGG